MHRHFSKKHRQVSRQRVSHRVFHTQAKGTTSSITPQFYSDRTALGKFLSLEVIRMPSTARRQRPVSTGIPSCKLPLICYRRNRKNRPRKSAHVTLSEGRGNKEPPKTTKRRKKMRNPITEWSLMRARTARSSLRRNSFAMRSHVNTSEYRSDELELQRKVLQ